MKIIREHVGETPERICHTLELPANGCGDKADDIVVAIDEDFLSWFYIAPGAPLSSTSLRLLELARSLIGPGAWAVVQVRDVDDPSWMADAGLCKIESYPNAAHHPTAVNVYVVQVMPGIRSS